MPGLTGIAQSCCPEETPMKGSVVLSVLLLIMGNASAQTAKRAPEPDRAAAILEALKTARGSIGSCGSCASNPGGVCCSKDARPVCDEQGCRCWKDPHCTAIKTSCLGKETCRGECWQNGSWTQCNEYCVYPAGRWWGYCDGDGGGVNACPPKACSTASRP